jgi:hypothetical protein
MCYFAFFFINYNTFVMLHYKALSHTFSGANTLFAQCNTDCASLCKSSDDDASCKKGCFAYQGDAEQCYTKCPPKSTAKASCISGCDQYVEIAMGATSPRPRNYFSKTYDSASQDGVMDFGSHNSWSDCQAFCGSNFSQVKQEQVPCKQACLLSREECGETLESASQHEGTFQLRIEATACAFTLGFHATKVDGSKARTCYNFVTG